jgi:hypothetical protein
LSPSLFLRVAADEIPLSENNMVARADHGMIPVGNSVPTRSANESDA